MVHSSFHTTYEAQGWQPYRNTRPSRHQAENYNCQLKPCFDWLGGIILWCTDVEKCIFLKGLLSTQPPLGSKDLPQHDPLETLVGIPMGVYLAGGGVGLLIPCKAHTSWFYLPSLTRLCMQLLNFSQKNCHSIITSTNSINKFLYKTVWQILYLCVFPLINSRWQQRAVQCPRSAELWHCETHTTYNQHQ